MEFSDDMDSSMSASRSNAKSLQTESRATSTALQSNDTPPTKENYAKTSVMARQERKLHTKRLGLDPSTTDQSR